MSLQTLFYKTLPHTEDQRFDDLGFIKMVSLDHWTQLPLRTRCEVLRDRNVIVIKGHRLTKTWTWDRASLRRLFGEVEVMEAQCK